MKADRSDWLHLLWAANTWERDEGLIDTVGRENLERLNAASHLDAEVASAARARLEGRIAEHAAAAIDAGTLLQRVDQVTQRFRLIGYNEFYAGHEGSIRQRLWVASDVPWGVDVEDRDLASREAQKWAAYYLAFTDFWLSGPHW